MYDRSRYPPTVAFIAGLVGVIVTCTVNRPAMAQIFDGPAGDTTRQTSAPAVVVPWIVETTPATTRPKGDGPTTRGEGARTPPPRQAPQDGDVLAAPPAPVLDGVVAPNRPVVPGDGDLSGDGRFFAPRPPTGLVHSVRGSIFARDPGRYGASADGYFHKGGRPSSDPYAALGIRAGSFLVFPEIVSEAVHTDNVFSTSGTSHSDKLVEVRPSLAIRSDWRRHALEFESSGLASFHDAFASEDERAFQTVLRGRLDVRRRTRLTGEVGYALTQEERNSLNFSAGAGERPDVRTRTANLALEHRFNRLALRVRGALLETDEDDTTLADGTIDRADDESYRDRTLGLRAGYEFSPGHEFFADAEISRLDFGAPSDNDGILRDADGHTLRLGLRKAFGARLSGEASVGYGRYTPDDDRLEVVDGVLFDANVVWQASDLTRWRLAARSGLGVTTLTGSLGSLNRSVGVDVRHAFRRYLYANAGVTYSIQDYGGVDLKEEDLVLTAGLEFFVSPDISLSAGYAFDRFTSNQAGRNYDENDFHLGLRVRR